MYCVFFKTVPVRAMSFSWPLSKKRRDIPFSIGVWQSAMVRPVECGQLNLQPLLPIALPLAKSTWEFTIVLPKPSLSIDISIHLIQSLLTSDVELQGQGNRW